MSNFTARDISNSYGYPAFDVIYCDPITWKCYYVEEPFCATMEEAQQAANEFNNLPADAELPAMYSLEEGE